MKKLFLLAMIALASVGIAPDVTFYFPKDKVTGLDVSVNFHYVFNFKEDGQGFSVYPLAGIGMQNNFYGKKSVEIDGKEMEMDRSNSTKFAFNLGGGITLPISERSYLIWIQILKSQHADNLIVFQIINTFIRHLQCHFTVK